MKQICIFPLAWDNWEYYKHKYTEAIEESQMIIMQKVALGPFLLNVWYKEEILPTCQRAPKQCF